MQNRRLITIFLIVFIGLLGFSIILPLLPYYAETFGASPTMVGLLSLSYALAQLIGAPVLGRLSDRYGRRPILLLSSLGTLVGFLILTPTDHRLAVLTFAAGAGLGYFLEYWGTTRECWTYYTLAKPPLFAVLAHGMAAVAFWRTARGLQVFSRKLPWVRPARSTPPA